MIYYVSDYVLYSIVPCCIMLCYAADCMTDYIMYSTMYHIMDYTKGFAMYVACNLIKIALCHIVLCVLLYIAILYYTVLYATTLNYTILDYVHSTRPYVDRVYLNMLNFALLYCT